MRLDLERIQVANRAYNTYVDIVSVSSNGKRTVSRTKSEPINSKTHINFGKHVYTQNMYSQFDPTVLPVTPGSNFYVSKSHFTSEKLHTLRNEPSKVFEQHSKAVESHISSYQAYKHSGSKFKGPSHKRSSSITERELNTSGYVPIIENRSMQRKGKISGQQIVGFGGDCHSALRIEKDFTGTVVSTQPQSLAVTRSDSCNEISNKDACFRCLKAVKNVVNCCTCIWCFDACCYHCFKDDVGYTSWFQEMLSCSKRPLENVQQWSLFGLATVFFPCILFYPILGGAVNQCIKCRLRQCQRKSQH